MCGKVVIVAFVAQPDRSFTKVHHKCNFVSSHQASRAYSQGLTIRRTVRHINSIVAGCTLIGFDLHLDLKVLGWTSNPPCQLLDLQKHYDSTRCSDLCHIGLHELDSGQPVHNLKNLAKRILHVCMATLYCHLYSVAWQPNFDIANI